MNKLKVIENELVPVYETSTGEKVVYGSELHEVLDIKSRFREWIERRLDDIDAIKNEDFQAAEISAPSGQTKKEYILKLDIAKEMAMLERNDKGKQVRRYFIEIEKKYRKGVPSSTSGQIHLLAQGYTELEEKVEDVIEKVDHLENNMVIDYSQQKTIKGLVSEVVISFLGGKSAKAYRYSDENGKSISKCIFSRFWHDFYDYFNVNAYANLPAVKFDEALRYINNWQPPTNMQLEIGKINRES